MPRIVRGALVQATWTGDKESMIQKHEERAHEAAKDGAQVILFQELFYGPYFCQVQDAQYYSYTELIPDGPTTKRMQDLAKQTGMVIVAPMYEEDSQASGIYYNTAAVIDADGTYLGKYRKTHIPHVKGFWEKFYFRPGNLGYPVFETAVGRVGERPDQVGWQKLRYRIVRDARICSTVDLIRVPAPYRKRRKAAKTRIAQPVAFALPLGCGSGGVRTPA